MALFCWLLLFLTKELVYRAKRGFLRFLSLMKYITDNLGFPANRCWGGKFHTVLEVAYVDKIDSTNRNCMIFSSQICNMVEAGGEPTSEFAPRCTIVAS